MIFRSDLVDMIDDYKAGAFFLYSTVPANCSEQLFVTFHMTSVHSYGGETVTNSSGFEFCLYFKGGFLDDFSTDLKHCSQA